MASIAILTSYPIVNPQHGGQLRASAITEKFRASGWEVHTLAVFEEGGYPFHSPQDVVFPSKSPYRKFHNQDILFIGDLQTSKFVEDEETVALAFSRLPADLNVIHVEQPWIWPLAVAYRKLVNPRVVLCYGSANIESELKAEILRSMTPDLYQALLLDIIGEIDALERRATLEADVVACVSQADCDVHRSWGGKRTIVAPNGVSWNAPAPEKVNQWRDRLGDVPFLVYIASAHPPNFTHFSEIFGGSLGCFPPDAKLVVVGSVSEHIYRQCLLGQFSSVNLSRLELLFALEVEDLAAIKQLAHGFLLPIPFGGGTNLKTAEALLSEKYVVGTEAAFRGFESYRDFPGILVCSSPLEIHGAIRRVLHSASLPVGLGPPRQELTWDHCLQPLVEAVEKEVGARCK